MMWHVCPRQYTLYLLPVLSAGHNETILGPYALSELEKISKAAGLLPSTARVIYFSALAEAIRKYI